MAKIRLRRDTATNWENANPTLALGEAGYDTTNNALRIGDGTTAWVDLTPIAGSGSANTGSITFAGVDIQGAEGVINLVPDPGVIGNGQYVTIYPTNQYDYPHIHIAPGNGGELYIGDDNQYVKTEINGNIVVSSNLGEGTTYQWNFGTDGNLTLPTKTEFNASPAVQSSGIVFGDGSIQTTAYVPPVTEPQLGYFTEMTVNTTDQVTGEAVAMDDAGNSYVSYSYYDNNQDKNFGGVAKFDSTGEKLWAVNIVPENTNAQYAKIASLEYAMVSGTPTLIALGNYYDNDVNKDVGFMYFVNTETGAAGSEFDVEISSPNGIRVNDGVFGIDDNSGPYAVLVGESYNENLEKTLTPLAPSTVDKLYFSWTDVNASGIQPGETLYYYVGGYYQVKVNGADVTASPNGSGDGIYLTISTTQAGAYIITRVNGWSGAIYGWNNPVTLRVLGSSLGGVDGVNDMTFDFDLSVFNNNSDNINAAVSNIAGTPITDVYCQAYNGKDWSTEIGNPVTFSYQLGSQAYIARLGTGGWTKNLGATNYETLNSVVVDNSGNVYAVGNYSNNSKAGLAIKYNSDGDQQWAVYTDSSNNMGNGLLSVDLLADGNLITVDEEATVTKINSSNGNIIWQVTADSSNNISWDSDFKGTATPDGNYIFANYEDDDYTMYVMCVSGEDGSVLWTKQISRAFVNQNGEIYPQNDFDAQYIDCNSTHVTIAATSYIYLNNNSNYAGLVINFPIDGEGIDGTYGQYIISTQTLDWNTESTTSTEATINEIASSATTNSVNTTDVASTFATDTINIGGTTANETVLGIERFSTSPGDNTVTLSADQNGKFMHYNGSDGNSWIYVPSNSDVVLPIGYTVTIVMDDFNGNQIYVNNNSGDANINAVGYSPGYGNYWRIGSNGNTGVYTLMKVDTDRWVLSGPDIQVD